MLSLILICIFAIVFGTISYFKPVWGVYIIGAGLPSFLLRAKVFDVPFTFLEVMILLLFVICLFKKQIDFKKIYRNYFFWPIVAILFFATVSLFVSPKIISGAGIWKAYFIEPILFWAIIVSLLRTKKQLERLFWALGISVLYLGALAIGQKFTGWGVPQAFMRVDGSVDRVVSILKYPNALGLYIGPIIVLFLGWLIAGIKNYYSVILKISVIVVGFIAIILAQSEAAVGAVVIACFILLILYKKTRISFLILGTVAVMTVLLLPEVREFVLTKFFLQDYSGMIRRIMWKETWKMLQYRWLFGAGLSGYQYYIYPYHLDTFEIYPYPHQIIFNFWSELGLGGLIAFIWLFIKYFWKNITAIFKNPGVKIMAITYICIGLQIIIHGLVDAPYFKNDLAVLFWIIIASAGINASLFSLHKDS